MPEVRLIDANALYEKVDESQAHNKHQGIAHVVHSTEHSHFKFMIIQAPTIEAEPVRHGRWIEVAKHRDENGTIMTDYECSECFAMLKDSYSEEIEDERFCYNCGAKMDLRTPTEVQLDESDSVMMGGADNG